MVYGKYNFLCRFEGDAVLPRYKGSTFRGVFGQALKMVVCALRRKQCEDCLLIERCVYSQVFEVQPLSGQDNMTRVSAKPHPYVIEPPLSTRTLYKKNDLFDFALLLFGDVNKNLPYFIYAFEQMGSVGIGKRINGSRGYFTLEEVRSGDNQLLYSRGNRILVQDSGTGIMELNSPQPIGTTKLRLNLITPLRLKFENRLKAELPFHLLVRAMLRRISSLLSYYGEGEPDLDYRGMVKRAQDVKTLESKLEWYDWRRYSFRQDKAMLMGGIVGSIVYEGRLGEFMPMIDFCTRVHLGKQTTFGLGKIKAEITS